MSDICDSCFKNEAIGRIAIFTPSGDELGRLWLCEECIENASADKAVGEELEKLLGATPPPTKPKKRRARREVAK